jgi:hypothetical protein
MNTTKHSKATVEPRPKWPRFPSMANAAGATGTPLSAWRAAKRMGSPGFLPSGVVDTQLLFPWLLTRGKKTEAGRSLDQARARLADAQADKITRDEQLLRGALVPVLWVRDMVGDKMEQPRLWIRERLQRLAWLVASVSGIDDKARREAEVLRILTGDANEILTMWGHAETGIENALRQGPPDGPERTALGDLETMCRRFEENVSAPARDEIRNYVAKLREEAEKQTAAPAPEQPHQSPAASPERQDG